MLPNWTEKDIDASGVQLHYYRTGSGEKPPLVLAHGFSDGGLCWLPVASDLQDQYDVILPDARGHGRSQRVQPGELLDMVADLANLIRVLRLQKPVVGGHSMGASVSAMLGARYPELVSALILEDPAWWLPKSEPEQPAQQEQQPRPNPYHEWLKSLENQTEEEVIAKCRSDSPTWPEVELRPWAQTKMQFDPNFFQVERSASMEWPEVVKRLQVPVLLITADPEKGAIVTPELADMAAEMNDKIRVVQIEGTGHNIRRENYGDYMAAVRDFLTDL